MPLIASSELHVTPVLKKAIKKLHGMDVNELADRLSSLQIVEVMALILNSKLNKSKSVANESIDISKSSLRRLIRQTLRSVK